jgi:NADPH-dependent curcumin reductase CurA
MDAQAVYFESYCDSGLPSAENFTIRTISVPVEGLHNEIIVKIFAISPDPYMRGRMHSSSPMKFPLGAPLVGFVVGEVILSAIPKWPVGSLFGASLPFQSIQRLSGDAIAATVFWDLSATVTKEQLTLGLGVFGMPGSTAHGGLVHVLRPRAGETLFISGAAGAVGSLVGMIAKNVFGCKVIGSSGSAEKCRFLISELGFDGAIDYKQNPTTEALRAALEKEAPQGIDMYFDNVGGSHFEAAFQSLRPGGRIAVCGGISQYNEASPSSVKINPLAMIYSAQRIEGFLCFPWLRKGSFLAEMKRWVDDKKIQRTDEAVYEGLEKFVEAFQSLLAPGSKNIGKVVVRL